MVDGRNIADTKVLGGGDIKKGKRKGGNFV
jgi:hypothetical protein